MEEVHYKAKEGYVFRRIADKQIFGSDIYLGYTYYINGVLLDTPHLEVIEDYEEVNQEMLEKEEEERIQNAKSKYPYYVEQYIRERYTVSDELAILRQRDVKVEDFEEYNTYCEDCKKRAKEFLGI